MWQKTLGIPMLSSSSGNLEPYPFIAIHKNKEFKFGVSSVNQIFYTIR